MIMKLFDIFIYAVFLLGLWLTVGMMQRLGAEALLFGAVVLGIVAGLVYLRNRVDPR
jgi:uncharacterized membrane protein (GlpM family)